MRLGEICPELNYLAMRRYEGDISTLISAFVESECSASGSSRFAYRERRPNIHWI
jgi:hypothetical protein